MTKVAPSLSLQDVTRRGFAEVGGEAEVLTLLPHRKAYQLYDMTNADRDPDKAAKLTYADVRALTKGGARAFAEDLARLSKCQLVPRDGPQAVTINGLQVSGARLMAEVGEAVMTLSAALEDGAIDAREADAIARQVQDVKAAAMTVLEKIAAIGARGVG